MPAAGEQGDEGRLQIGRAGIGGGEMPADMVRRDEGFVQRIGERLGKGHPDEQRAQKPRAVSDGDGVQISVSDARLFHGALHHGGNRLGMGAGGDLRHYAAVKGLHVRRRSDFVGQDGTPAHDGGGRLVAGGFDA